MKTETIEDKIIGENTGKLLEERRESKRLGATCLVFGGINTLISFHPALSGSTLFYTAIIPASIGFLSYSYAHDLNDYIRQKFPKLLD
ncbi:hypothetical protein J4414_02380 [Candidatus Woesearchaeota archaeon]|nr:hypothetical protein [Candidatus Woesearchaeota archaeon]